MKKSLFYLVVIFFFSALLVNAAEKHVTTWGDDSNPGTSSEPWRTVSHAGENAVAGDIVYIHEGFYHDRLAVRNSGAESNPIIFTNYGDDVAVIDGSDIDAYDEMAPTTGGRPWFGTVDLYDASWIEIRGLQIKNSTMGNGVFGSNTHNCIIEGNYIEKTHTSGIGFIIKGLQYDADNQQVRPQDESQWSVSTNITIRDNEITQTNINGWSEVISLEGVEGFEISGNLVHDTYTGRTSSFWGGGGEMIDMKRGTRNGKCFGNVVYNSFRLGIYVESNDSECNNIEIYNNVVSNLDHSGIVVSNEGGGEVYDISIHDNVVYNCNFGILFATHDYWPTQVVRDVQVYNNTVAYSNAGTLGEGQGLRIDNPELSNLEVRNNIFAFSDGNQIWVNGVDDSRFTIDNNLIYPAVTEGGSIRTGTNAIMADPLFADAANKNFSILSGSPAIDEAAGAQISTSDFRGVSRPYGAAADIGAFEYNGSSFTPDAYELSNDIYEAEDATTMSGVNALADTETAEIISMGGRYVDFGASGTYLEWDNINEGSGTKTLLFRYFNGGSNNRSCDITVNGSAAGSVAFKPMGEWTTVGIARLVVTLNSGNNTIRVTANADDGGPNLDNVTVLEGNVDRPVAPSTLTASVASLSEVNLNWTDNSDNEDGFIIYRRDSVNFDVVGIVTPNNTSFTDNKGLDEGIDYCYHVRAFNEVEKSDISNDACVTVINPGKIYTQDAGSDGEVIMEAESYSSKIDGKGSFAGMAWTEYSDANASNGKYMMVPDNDNTNAGPSTDAPLLNYTIDFVKTGTHYVWFRIIAPNGSDNSIKPAYDGLILSEWNSIETSSWAWTKYDQSFDATPERHTFGMYMREDAMQIDKIIITSNPDYVPGGGTPSNIPPTANAGSDQTVTDSDDSGAETVTLDGTGSSDSDGSIASYTWAEGGTTLGTGATLDYSFSVGTHTVTLTVEDNDGATDSDNVTIIVEEGPSGGCTADGTILMEKYDGISGTSITSLTGASIYPDNPTSTSELTSFEIPTNVDDNYGIRVRGYLCAPENGSYTFWIAGDDNVELYLSTDNSPSNKVLIAYHTGWTNSREWTKYPDTQESDAITLSAGQSYYIEALMKEASGGDNLAVGWRKPSDGSSASPVVIPGSVLSPASGSAPPANEAPVANAGSDQTVTDSDDSGAETVTLDGTGSSDSDGSIASYTWAEGGTTLGTGATLDYSFSVGTHTVTLTVEDNDGATDTDNVTITVEAASGTPGDLPSPWVHADIGDVLADGSATYSDGTFTIIGSGMDIWYANDEFHYVYQSLSGDGVLIARVESVENTDSWAKAGVMIREELTNNAKNALMAVTPLQGLSFQYRTTTGGQSDYTKVSGSAPHWVKIERSGNTFTGSISTDGSSWSVVGSTTISMNTDVYIGMAVTAHNDGELCTAGFSNVSTSGTKNAIISGISNTDFFDNISIYPNPSNRIFFIEGKENSIISIYDTHGKLVTRKILEKDFTQVDLGEYNEGLYIIRIKHADSVITRKLILME